MTKLNDFLFNAGGDYVVGIVFRFPEVVENPESELGFLHQEINGYVNEHEFRNWGNQLIVDKLRGIN